MEPTQKASPEDIQSFRELMQKVSGGGEKERGGRDGALFISFFSIFIFFLCSFFFLFFPFPSR